MVFFVESLEKNKNSKYVHLQPFGVVINFLRFLTGINFMKNGDGVRFNLVGIVSIQASWLLIMSMDFTNYTWGEVFFNSCSLLAVLVPALFFLIKASKRNGFSYKAFLGLSMVSWVCWISYIALNGVNYSNPLLCYYGFFSEIAGALFTMSLIGDYRKGAG
jgi:hypothetical protein